MKNTFVKVLSMMIALMMVVGMFSTVITAAECNHANRTETVEPATCEDAGFTKVKCDDCQKEWIEKVVPANGEHSWKDVKASDATCTEYACSAHKVCTACGKTEGKVEDEEGGYKAHEFVVYYKQDVTCDQDGFISKQCKNCPEIDTKPTDQGGNYELVEKAGHKLKYTVIDEPGSCTNGSYAITCERAGCDFSELIADNDKKHTEKTVTTGTVNLAGEGLVTVGLGCDKKYSSLKYCEVCGVKIEGTLNTDMGHKNATVVKVGGGDLTATDVNEKLIAETQLNIGDPTYVAANCVDAGYTLKYCAACDKYFKDPGEISKTHVTSTVTVNATTADDYDHTQDTVEVTTCSVDGCDYEKRTVKTKGAPHEMDTEVTPMSCTSNGYTTHFCTVDGCSYTYDDTIVYATGHDWTEWTFAAKATEENDEGCTSTAANAMVRTCKNEDCSGIFDETWGLTTQASNKEKHTFDVVNTAATCVDNAKNENVCVDCGYNAGTTDVEQPAAGTVATNHVVKDLDITRGEVLQVVQEKNCTRPEKSDVTCACGEVLTVITAKADEHHIVDVDETPSTCKTQGLSAGKKCDNDGCTYWEVPQTKLPLDPENHEPGDLNPATKVITTIDATCSSVAYQKVYYYCCGEDYVVEVEDSEVNPAKHVNAKKTDAIPATCFETGYIAYYYCSDCEQYMTVSGDTYDAASATDDIEDLDPVVPRLSEDNEKKGEHNWSAATTYTAEKCGVDGVKSYQVCECGAWLIHNVDKTTDIVFDDAATEADERQAAIVIPMHGAKYLDNLSWKNGTPDCHNGAYVGIPNTLICSKCGSDSEDDMDFDTQYWSDPTEHNKYPVYSQSTATDCTVATYTVYKCHNCTDQWVEGYTDANVKAGHVYTDEDGEYLESQIVASETKGADCENAGYTTYKCVNCEEKTKVAGEAAKGHFYMVNGNRLPLSFSCVDYEANKGLKCVDCQAEVNAITLAENHNKISDEKNATCTEDGYNVEYCADCGETFNATFTEKHGHLKTILIDEQAPTVEVAGYKIWKCARCGENWTEDLGKLNPAADDITIVLGDSNTLTLKDSETIVDSYTDGSEIAITVSLSAEQVIGVSAIKLNLTYSDNLKFNAEKTEWAADTKFEILQAAVDNNDDAVVEGVFVEGDADFVSITAATAFDIGKAPVDAEVGAEQLLVTLYFTVDNAEKSDLDAWVQLTDAEILNAAEKELKVDTTKYAKYELEVDMLLNANGDEDLSMADVLVAAQIFSEQGYDATIDLDKDGEITITDLYLILDYINGAQTYDQVAGK